MKASHVGIIAASVLLGAWSAGAQQDAKDIYLDKCAVCHGADGSGKTAKGRKLKVKDVRETVSKMSAAEMMNVVENGKGAHMDAYGKQLAKQQIQAVVDYYRGLTKK